MTAPRVRFGICLTQHLDALPPHAVAREAEARGIDAFFVPENSHVPVDRSRTLRPFEGAERLARFHDPLVTLAACAAVTSRIRLGTSVCLLTQREPVPMARAVADLDRLANGRLVLGVAGGFIREAMEHHGSAFADRWPIVRERVLAMRRMWTQAQPAFAGEFVNFGPLPHGAPALQGAGPPVWIGSNSKWVPDRVADYADGWITRRELYEGDAVADLRRACERRGRRFEELTVALMGAPLDAAEAARCLEAGYAELVFFVSDADPAALHRRLDAVAELAVRLRATFDGERPVAC